VNILARIDLHAVGQIIRYGLVGLLTNILGYAVYLTVTYIGFDPKETMSFFYFIGAVLGFVGHKKLSFAYDGHWLGAGFRYIIAHSIGYLFNLTILTICVDWYGYPHQYVQAIAILMVAAILFLLFKFFVFPAAPTQHNSVPIPAPAGNAE
jgi:putative flippase GtrA